MTVAGTPENVYYYHNDHLGTPQIMTDSTGTVVWAATYEPFGQATMNVEQITNNLRFPGQYFDSETGTHYNGHRDYNNELGRYIESDPIGLPGGINLYVYVLDSPINWIDPFGYFSGDIHISITNLALSKYGASQSSKDKINAGNVYVDRPDNFFNNNEHGMSNWGQYKSDAINRSLLFKENQLRLAIDAAKKCSFQESFFHLGQALHSIQDEIAHDFISLPTHLGDPEYSYRDHYPRESQYREATSISERYIERYLKELGCNPFKHNNDCCCNKNKK
jgi:RHS repeat-associated protein